MKWYHPLPKQSRFPTWRWLSRGLIDQRKALEESGPCLGFTPGLLSVPGLISDGPVQKVVLRQGQGRWGKLWGTALS